MSELVRTPAAPYYIVTFTSIRTEGDNGYNEMSAKMVALAKEQEGFLGIESVRGEIGITLSYWRDMDAIQKWGRNIQHLEAKKLGKEKWYEQHITRIAKVEREY